jgi:hypothetical protein
LLVPTTDSCGASHCTAVAVASRFPDISPEAGHQYAVFRNGQSCYRAALATSYSEWAAMDANRKWAKWRPGLYPYFVAAVQLMCVKHFYVWLMNLTEKKNGTWHLVKKKLHGLESASELYRPSDRRLSAKWLPTFADTGCHVVSVTDPWGRILGFLDRSRYFSIK